MLTGWLSDVEGRSESVVEHAVARADADRHRALCGASLPVVDRALPWAGRGERCCEHCQDAVRTAA